jgi:hypothetical protein
MNWAYRILHCTMPASGGPGRRFEENPAAFPEHAEGLNLLLWPADPEMDCEGAVLRVQALPAAAPPGLAR